MWIYMGKEFTEADIPEEAVGFVYEMMSIIDGKLVRYIGKKNFYADVKVKLGKKAMPTDKRLKTYKRVRKTTYLNYYSSNETLKQAHKDKIQIKREILMICYSPTELTYQEAKLLFCRDVLDDPMYLNSNILGKFYKTK